MKKKTLKALEEMKAKVSNIKDMRFLLKGINIDTNQVKIGEDYPDWPITAPVIDGGELKIAYDRLAYIDNNGYYFCEFQDDSKDKNCNVYLTFYNYLKVKELIVNDEEIDIDQHSFFQYGIGPSFQMFSTKRKLEEKEDNFVEIINKKMKKTNKKANKLAKKLKN